MSIFIKIIGLLFIVMGIVYMAKPDVIRKMITFFRVGNRFYLIGLIRLVLAVVFLAAARECNIAWLIFAFGILFLASGLTVFLMGRRRVNACIEWWLGKPAWLLRLLSVVVLAIGGLILYAA